MKILLSGDKFITVDIMRDAVAEVFGEEANSFEYVTHTGNWPIDPICKNDEVSEFCGTDSDLISLVEDVDVIMTHTGCVTKKLIEAAKNLKVLGVGRGGPVNINVKACTEREIPVVNAPGRNSGAVTEFTIGLMLSLTRNITFCHDSFFNNKQWRGDMYAYEYIGNELGESTVGLVGFGAIGMKVTKILNAFGSRVLVYDPYIKEEDQKKHDCTFVDLETLMKSSDVVSLHARYSKETEKMIDEKLLALMKPSAVLINTARGELVDHDALYDALASKKIKGAALDVFEGEPPADNSKLFDLDNVIACTHLGGASIQAAEIGATKAIQGVYDILHGNKPEFCVNPEVLK
ncbi:2-hydroxyacid dehydrogenase [Alkalibacter rhizosphaerae]|uniref:2-hydroxyacid dehydrogenase n=1 Tax=Alkalibacter rhizosphaerae TaxID=2815577 RepID=A0A974XGF9_9FIRM|nr:2-hydroxyacid dehydrogenase [Alkalibacter rhizosphaerae]QSX09231.1 2-hydroxyacid dehydrogenase [Alkalibacter rhizosphaerae]